MKLLLTLLLISSSFALECDTEKLDSIPVLNGGRVKTLLVWARETSKALTGKVAKDPISFICTYNMNGQKDLLIPIEHSELRVFLGNKEQVSLMAMIQQQEEIKMEIMKQKENSSYKKALNKLWFRMDKFTQLTQGDLWKVPVKLDSGFSWHSFKDIYPQGVETDTLIKRTDAYDKSEDTSYQLENIIVKTHLFSLAMLLSLLAIIFLVIKKSASFGLVILFSSIVFQVTGMVLRIYISGRAPITNMYETVMFSGLGALILGVILFYYKKDKVFLLAGLGYNILCLFMMKFSGGMLDENISPLVPVLRDNFWLSTHVTTIILSYAALALSWMVANITLFKQRFGVIEPKEYRYYDQLIYTSIKVGTVLLSAGIILGGVWADYSWGRFWGWDPKETWSLIVFLFYMILLHGRGTNWINTHRFILCAAGGFMLVMMAWFGVNYILAVGLHSYGFSEGGAIFLGSFFLIQIIILIGLGKRKQHRV